jgi:competence protein ComEA
VKRLLILVSLIAFSTLASAAALNLNSATQDQLAGLQPIGSVKAKAIIDYRGANGCFKSVNDLLKVKGMTQADVDAVKEQVVAGTCAQGGPGTSKAQT